MPPGDGIKVLLVEVSAFGSGDHFHYRQTQKRVCRSPNHAFVSTHVLPFFRVIVFFATGFATGSLAVTGGSGVIGGGNGTVGGGGFAM